MQTPALPIRLCINGRRVATIRRDRDGSTVLEKRGLDPLRHRLNQPPAWALDAAHVAALREAGERTGAPARIQLHLLTGESLEISLTDFDRYAFPLARGHGLQLAVAEYRWTVRGPDGRLVEPVARAPATAPHPPARAARRPGVEQLRLLDAAAGG